MKIFKAAAILLSIISVNAFAYSEKDIQRCQDIAIYGGYVKNFRQFGKSPQEAYNTIKNNPLHFKGTGVINLSKEDKELYKKAYPTLNETQKKKIINMIYFNGFNPDMDACIYNLQMREERQRQKKFVPLQEN